MSDAPTSSRPNPRTPAAVEAELRRLIRAGLAEARATGGDMLTEAALASVVARAIAAAFSWHLDAHEHAALPGGRRQWRPAAGPRGRPPGGEEWRNEVGFEPASRPPFRGKRPPLKQTPRPDARPRGLPAGPGRRFEAEPAQPRRPGGRRPPGSPGGGFAPRRRPPA